MNAKVTRGLTGFALSAGIASCMAIAVAGCAGAGTTSQHGPHALPHRAPHHFGRGGRPTSAKVMAVRRPGSPTRATARSTADYDGPRFASPAAAMKYLAFAYNQHDLWALRQVTRPTSYKELAAMRAGAVDLRLKSCSKYGDHGVAYVCWFVHDYPASLHKSGHGATRVLVVPARNPGWSMWVIMDCG